MKTRNDFVDRWNGMMQFAPRRRCPEGTELGGQYMPANGNCGGSVQSPNESASKRSTTTRTKTATKPSAKQGTHVSSTKGLVQGSAAEIKSVRALAKQKIKNAKKPTPEKKAKHCAAIARSNALGKRPGGEFRGNSADRKRRQLNLWREFGGDKRGYVIDHITGVRMHWTSDKKENPNGYPVFSQGKIYTGEQGGSYTNDNLLPELLQANQSRGSKPIKLDVSSRC